MIKHYRFLFFALLLSVGGFGQSKKSSNNTLYYPAINSWEKRSPESVGLSPLAIQKAIKIAQESESSNPRSMEENHYKTFGKEPFGDGIGPFEDRGDQTGIIIYKGYKIAEWGTPLKCDMTHSVAKSFLSSVVGLAVDQQLIHSVNDFVAPYVPPIELFTTTPVTKPAEQFKQSELLQPFNTPHNKSITWESMLRQTSDWEGTLWGKPDWADRPDPDPKKWLNRTRNTPGTVYEYNDVRVNALALAVTSVFRKPLPQVLKQYIMDPIGASTTWRWTGYRNSWIVLDGQPVQAVSGGGHWGGGMFIHAEDMARFGLLTLRNGKWNNQPILSEAWLKQARTPGPANPEYGYMNFFLNTHQKFLPAAPASAFVHVGNGNNIIYVDQEHDLVVVLRWITQSGMNQVIGAILEALK
ncbi:MAG: serine hydrolase domain-containing protein [Sediminibacterium sp.]